MQPVLLLSEQFSQYINYIEDLAAFFSISSHGSNVSKIIYFNLVKLVPPILYLVFIFAPSWFNAHYCH